MRRVLALSVLLIVCTCSCSENAGEGKVPEKIDGLCLVAPPDDPAPEKYTEIRNLGAEWVAIIPYGFSLPGETVLHYNTEGQWKGERTEGILRAIKHARANNLKIMMKPHLWVKGQGWMGDFTLEKEEDWVQWQSAYEDYLLYYARLSDSLNVEILCIGTEMRQVVIQRQNWWPELIRKVRKVYRGKLTYAANWDNYENVGFWNELDYIGIDAYFPLSNTSRPAINELLDSWEPVAAKLRELSVLHKRPILFTEYGYESRTSNTAGHWQNHDGEYNEVAQATALEALYRTFWSDNDWFAGGFLWKWHLSEMTMERRGVKEPYTVQGKSGQESVKKWYKSP